MNYVVFIELYKLKKKNKKINLIIIIVVINNISLYIYP